MLFITFFVLNIEYLRLTTQQQLVEPPKGCFFNTDNLISHQSESELCDVLCNNTPECTHYTWNLEHKGTCWLKSGHVTYLNAIYSPDYKTQCGIMPILDSDMLTRFVSNVTTAKIINLAYVRFISIEWRTFQGLKRLNILKLNHNRLTSLDSYTFIDLIELKELYLHHNELEQIEADLFKNLINLKYLTLNDNKLYNLDVNSFNGLTSLNQLYLEHNKLEFFDEKILSNFSNLNILSLDNQIVLNSSNYNSNENLNYKVYTKKIPNKTSMNKIIQSIKLVVSTVFITGALVILVFKLKACIFK